MKHQGILVLCAAFVAACATSNIDTNTPTAAIQKQLQSTIEQNVSNNSEANLSYPVEPSVLAPARSYRWFEGDKVRPKLMELLHAVQSDSTIVCKEELPYKRLQELVKKYRTSHDAALKDQIENQADLLETRYQQVRNGGCYDPQQFLQKDTYILPRHKSREGAMRNPVLLRLYDALEKYTRLAQLGGWGSIDNTNVPYVRPGHHYDILPAIKKRLAFEGYYGEDDNSTFYGSKFVRAVQDFQRHHGLNPDGVIGPATFDAMNVPAEERIKKILINIERAKWFLRNDSYFVFVDIPGFFMQVYDKGKPIFYSRVVVGRKKRPTPQMRNAISYAVVNPYWRAPKTIIQKDIWPRLQSGDFDALRKSGIVATKDYKGNTIVEYEDVDWSRYDEEHLPFIFMQMPGPHNFLGVVKFMFPNRFDVYLHDTNHKNLFRYRYRALSSGCVRVQKPLELFHLLRMHTRGRKYTYRDILDLIQDGERKIVRFRPIIPVYLLYLTVYEDDRGKVYFFKDIYNLDKKMLAGLPKLDTIAAK